MDWVEKRKPNKRDLDYLSKGLSPERRQQFQSIYKVKTKPVKEKHSDIRVHKACLSVVDNPGFASELALAFSRHYPKKRVALLETDRLNPMLQDYLNCESHVKNMYHHLARDQSTGLHLLIDGYHKQALGPHFSDQVAIGVKGHSNIYFFSGSYKLGDYEYFDLEDYKQILAFLADHYDILILHTNGFIYDGFTCYSLVFSDLNLLALDGQWPIIKQAKATMAFLEDKQGISQLKNYYLMFNYKPNHQMSQGDLALLLKGQVLSPVLYDKRRSFHHKRRYLPCRRVSSRQKKDYKKLIRGIHKGVKKYELNKKSSC